MKIKLLDYLIEIKKIMWTFNITNKTLENGIPKITVNFEHPTLGRYPRVYVSYSEESLKEQIKNELKQVETATTFIDSLGTSVDLSPVTPTKEDLDKQNYFNLLTKFHLCKRDIEYGLIDPSSQMFLDLEKSVKEAYKPEYSGL